MNPTRLRVIGLVALGTLLLSLGALTLWMLSGRQSFEYQICNAQGVRLTYVNGKWQGKVAPDPNDVVAALNSCPQTWDYLNTAGSDGWELVASVPVTTVGSESAQLLYLRRPK
jgi:hypothetical protein